jgi:predicted ATP-dependent protease
VSAVEGSAVQAVTRDILTLLDKGEWSKADRRSLITNPKTGWTIFLNEQRVLNPQKRLCDISKEMASVWQAMSDDQKTPYNEKSSLDHKRYEDQFNALSSDEKKLLRKIKSQTKRERKEKSEKLGKVLSAFMLYSADKRKFVLESNPDAKVTKVASIIGKMWTSESEEVRAQYHARREEMKTNVLKESADAEAAAVAAGSHCDAAADILLDKPVGFGFGSSGTLVGVNA